MKRVALLLTIALALCCAPNRGRAQSSSPARRQITFSTITAGTPVQVWTSGPLIVAEYIIQPQASATNGLVYVMAGITAGRTPNKSTSGDLTASLCAASATVPGCTYSDGTTVQQATGIDLSTVWLDVATTNTPVVVSYQIK